MKSSIHEGALRITNEDGTSTFQELLHKENFASFFFFFKSALIDHKNANFGDRNVYNSKTFVCRNS